LSHFEGPKTAARRPEGVNESLIFLLKYSARDLRAVALVHAAALASFHRQWVLSLRALPGGVLLACAAELGKRRALASCLFDGAGLGAKSLPIFCVVFKS